jgi:hypothetical protein
MVYHSSRQGRLSFFIYTPCRENTFASIVHFCCTDSLLMTHRGGLILSIIICRIGGGGPSFHLPWEFSWRPWVDELYHISIFYCYHWVDKTVCITRPVVGVLALTWLIICIYYWIVQFLNKVIIIKNKISFSQELVTLSHFDLLV